ncbi:MAG: hypothetical protein MR430_10305 [Lachnospiraceae bacterium]|nr:hypothetical protein [Lachnospiraceae bacterium]
MIKGHENGSANAVGSHAEPKNGNRDISIPILAQAKEVCQGDKEKIMEWLDLMVYCIRKIHGNRCLELSTGKVREVTLTEEKMQIYSGIEILADAIGAKLVEEVTTNAKNPLRYYFMYRDVEFYMINDERLPVFAGDVQKDKVRKEKSNK